ncbi:protein unc-79 homolog isoform X2 [Oscarella lobularis]
MTLRSCGRGKFEAQDGLTGEHYEQVLSTVSDLIDAIPDVVDDREELCVTIVLSLEHIAALAPPVTVVSIPHIVASAFAIFPKSSQDALISLLCDCVIPTCLVRCMGALEDESDELACLDAIPFVIMSVLEHSSLPKHYVRLMETLLNVKDDVVKDLLEVIADGDHVARGPAVRLLFHYWPGMTSEVEFKLRNAYWTTRKCNVTTCKTPKVDAVKVCLDPVLAFKLSKSFPPLFMCPGCLFLLEEEGGRFATVNVAQPPDSLFSDRQISARGRSRSSVYDGRSVKELVQADIPRLWDVEISGELQNVLLQAVCQLLQDASPGGFGIQSRHSSESSLNELDEHAPAADGWHMDVIDNTINDRRILSRYGVLLLVNKCMVTGSTCDAAVLGRVIAAVLQWLRDTSTLPDGPVGNCLGPLKETCVKEWLTSVCSNEQTLAILSQCLEPDPPISSRFGGCWNTLTSNITKHTEGLSRISTIITWNVIPFEAMVYIWDAVMPSWMEAIKRDISLSDLGEFRLVFRGLFPMLPIPNDEKYAFIYRMFDKTGAGEQAEAIFWLQNITRLEIQVPGLVKMFIKGVQSPFVVDSSSFSFGQFPAHRTIATSSGAGSPTSTRSASSVLHSPVFGVLDANTTLNRFVLMLDLLVEQKALDVPARKTLSNSHLHYDENEGRDIHRLLLAMLNTIWGDDHRGDHREASNDCPFCHSTNLWFFLAHHLLQFTLPKKQASRTSKKKKSRKRLDQIHGVELSYASKSISKDCDEAWNSDNDDNDDDDDDDDDDDETFVEAKVVTSPVREATVVEMFQHDDDPDPDARDVAAKKAAVALVGSAQKKRQQFGQRAFVKRVVTPADRREAALRSESISNAVKLVIGCLSKLEVQRDVDVMCGVVKCIKVLCVDAECLSQAQNTDHFLLKKLLESALVPHLWNMLRSEQSQLAEACVPVLLHCLAYPYAAELVWKELKGAFDHKDWRVRFNAVEKVVVLGRFLEKEEYMQSKNVANSSVMSTLALAFSQLLGATEDIDPTVALRATLLLKTIKMSSMKLLFQALKHQFKFVSQDRPLILLRMRTLLTVLPNYDLLSACVLNDMLKHIREDSISTTIDVPDFSISFGNGSFASGDGGGGGGGGSSSTRTATGPRRPQITRKPSSIHSLAQDEPSRSQHNYGKRRSTVEKETYRSKTLESSVKSVAMSIGVTMESLEDAPSVEYSSERLGAGFSQYLSQEVTINQYVALVQKSVDYADCREQFVIDEGSGQLHEAAIRHQFITLLLQFMCKNDNKSSSSTEEQRATNGTHMRRERSKISKPDERKLVGDLYSTLGWAKVNEYFNHQPEEMRSYSEFSAFLSGIAQVFDENVEWGKKLLDFTIGLLLYCPATDRDSVPKEANDRPQYSLAHLTPEMQRHWLTTVIIILYKYDWAATVENPDDPRPPASDLELKVLWLVDIALHTLENPTHCCAAPQQSFTPSPSPQPQPKPIGRRSLFSDPTDERRRSSPALGPLGIIKEDEDDSLQPETKSPPPLPPMKTISAPARFSPLSDASSVVVRKSSMKKQGVPRKLLPRYSITFSPDTKKGDDNHPADNDNDESGNEGNDDDDEDERRASASSSSSSQMPPPPPPAVEQSRGMSRSSSSSSSVSSVGSRKASTTYLRVKESIASGGSPLDHDRFCPACGEVMESFSEDVICLALIAVGTFAQRDQEHCALLLEDVLNCYAKVATRAMFPWQTDKARTKAPLPGSSVAVARQLMRCILVQYAGNGLFLELFRQLDGDPILIRAVAECLPDKEKVPSQYPGLTHCSPIVYVLEEFPKNISHTDLPIVLGNLTSYVKHLPFPISKDIVPLFVRLFRKLKSIHKEMDDDNKGYDFVLKLMADVLLSASSNPSAFRVLLPPFSDILSQIIEEETITVSLLWTICSRCFSAFAVKERDKEKGRDRAKDSERLTRTVIAELDQSLRFKKELKRGSCLLNLIKFVAIDMGAYVGTVKDTTGKVLGIKEMAGRTGAKSLAKGLLPSLISFLGDAAVFEHYQIGKMAMQLKTAVAQLVGLYFHENESLIQKDSVWLSNSPWLDDCHSAYPGYKELERIGRNSSIICWILLGAIAYNISTAAIDGVSECIPFKENIAGKFVELCTLPIDSLAEQSKDLEDATQAGILSTVYCLCQHWTVYCEFLFPLASSSSPSIVNFWNAITVSILRALSVSEKRNTISAPKLPQILLSPFVSTINALQPLELRTISKFLPQWSQLIDAYRSQARLGAQLEDSVKDWGRLDLGDIAWDSNHAKLTCWVHHAQHALLNVIKFQAAT